MKCKLKTILSAILIIASIVGAFLLGKTQIPKNYIPLEECIPLEDIACYFIDEYDYPCFELKDVGNQLDNPNNVSYEKIMKKIEKEDRR